MPDYRRHRVPGGIYFFTVNLRDRRSHLLVTEIDTLRSAVRAAWARRPLHIDAWVVLPDHMHCLWTLPPGDMDFPVRWRTIKATFSRCVPPAAERRASLVRKREAGIWQRRYWEHAIRDERVLRAYRLHPFQSGEAWTFRARRRLAFSSFRRCVAFGMYPGDWESSGCELASAG